MDPVVGSAVLLRGNTAVVRYVGQVSFASGTFVGVEFHGPHGRNDGSVAGKRYFMCAPHHGLFVRPAGVTSLAETDLDERAAAQGRGARAMGKQSAQQEDPSAQATGDDEGGHDDSIPTFSVRRGPALGGASSSSARFAPPLIPQLSFPTPRARKIVSARYKSVKPKYMQPAVVGSGSARAIGTPKGSARAPKGSARSSAGGESSSRASQRAGAGGGGGGDGGGGSSVAANVAASKAANARNKPRYQPTVDEISQALAERPYLVNQIVAIRDDPTLDRAGRHMEIGKVIRECEGSAAVSGLEKAQANYTPTREQMNGRRAAVSAYTKFVKAHVDLKAPIPESPDDVDATAAALWREHGGDELGHMLQYVDLVDARYLIALHEHGGNLPCWGALPDRARIGRATMWRLFGWRARGCLGVIALSQCARSRSRMCSAPLSRAVCTV